MTRFTAADVAEAFEFELEVALNRSVGICTTCGCAGAPLGTVAGAGKTVNTLDTRDPEPVPDAGVESSAATSARLLIADVPTTASAFPLDGRTRRPVEDGGREPEPEPEAFATVTAETFGLKPSTRPTPVEDALALALLDEGTPAPEAE